MNTKTASLEKKSLMVSWASKPLDPTISRSMVLQRVGMQVLWLDNNSDCKGTWPYALAPEAQTHVTKVTWFGNNTQAQLGIERGCLQSKSGQSELSHDNLFHSVLGLFEVQTSLFHPGLDIFRGCRRPMTANQ